MDLTAWCGDGPQGAAGLWFAQAVARERARRRGVRQRVQRNRGEMFHGYVWAIFDAPPEVTEPCS